MTLLIDPNARQPNWKVIQPADLSDEGQLAQLYLDAVRRGWWANSEESAQRFWERAVQALRGDRQGTPGALFTHLIRKGSNSKQGITPAIQGIASSRLLDDDRVNLVSQVRLARPNEHRESMAAGDESSSKRIAYLHTTLMQCFLPQRMPDAAEREWVARYKKARLIIRAGYGIDPHNPGRLEELPLPWGAAARLLLAYIIGLAVQTNSPDVDMGKTVRGLVTDLGVKTYGGPVEQQYRMQARSIAAAEIRVVEWDDKSIRERKAYVADDITFWCEGDQQQPVQWRSVLRLSDRFFEIIQKHCAPLNLDHLVALRSSPRRQDLYLFLCRITYSLQGQKRIQERLTLLQEILAPGIAAAHTALFRQRLRQDLLVIKKIWPELKAQIRGEYLYIAGSPPPVPPRKGKRLVSGGR